MLELLDLPDSNIIGFQLDDTLTEDDYDVFEFELKAQIESHTTTRVLFEIDDVEGWEPEDQWESLAFDIRHVQEVDKVSVVGDDPWAPLLDKIELLFPSSQIQAYDTEDREEALEWIRGEMDVPGIGPGSVPDPKAGPQDERE